MNSSVAAGRTELPIVEVLPDHFEVLLDDGLLQVTLQGSIALCLYDAVEEAGAVVHLRVVVGTGASTDASDETLAADLMLISSCMERLKIVAPAARHWQGRVLVHHGTDGGLELLGRSIVQAVTHCCTDRKIRIVQSDAQQGASVTMQFRPSMGQYRLNV